MAQPKFPKFPVANEEDPDIQEMYDTYFEEFQKIKIKAQRRAIEDKMTQYYKKLIDEEQYESFHGTAVPVLKQLHSLKTASDNIVDTKQGQNPYCFFTINVKPEKAKENSLEEFSEELKDFTEKQKYLKDVNMMYTIEQRSEGNDEVEGIHCHMLFEKGKNSPSKLQRAFNNKFFDKWVGTHAALDYKYISESRLDSKIEYILGQKETGKMPKVIRDRQMKDAHGLPWYVSRGFEENIERIKSSAVII